MKIAVAVILILSLPGGFLSAQKLDSARSALADTLGINSLATKAANLHLPDSLKPDLSRYTRKLDSVKGKLTHKIDSLQKLNLSTASYQHVLDSLQHPGPIGDIKQAEAKLAALETKINQPVAHFNATVSKATIAINEKISLVNKQGGNLSTLPRNLAQPTLPGIQPPSLPNGNLKLPSGSLPANPLNQAQGLEGAGKIQDPLQGVSGAPQDKLGELKTSGELGKVQKELGDVSKVGSQAKEYSKDLKNISQGNFDSLTQVNKDLEARAAKMAKMNELQSQTKIVDQYKGMAAQGNNPEALKALAMQQAPAMAIDHFAGKEQVLQAAMDKLSQFKTKYPYISSVSDITKPVRNQMNGKPFRERIIPGFALQYQNRNGVLIDFNPYIGYKISGRWSAGLGWVERISFNGPSQARVYGLRGYTDIMLGKGISARGEAERINAYIPLLQNNGAAEGSRQWIWGAFVGLKKDYRISKAIKGNIQTLYYLTTYPSSSSPYASKFNVRLGFEFPLRKKEGRKR